jgi:GTP-binding protein
MKFIDEVTITVFSGNGGAGSSSFRREKFIPKGGPDGGDGGNGGSVYFTASTSYNTLYHLKGKKIYKASHGRPGEGNKRTGARGEDIVIELPVGTIIKDLNTDEVIVDLVEPNKKVLILKGGKGGLGNWHFKNSINQAPKYSQSGIEGETLELKLELKSVADVGLVGYPNAGKSTLISVVSNAKPEIGDYPFTTLTPHLGVVSVDRFTTFVIADIPGIIEGAHKGAGLGIQFLKHIERTKIFLHIIEYDPHVPHEELLNRYKNINNELLKYKDELGDRPYLIVISKIDMIENDEAYDELKELFKPYTNDKLYFISAPLQEGTKELVNTLFQKLQELNATK